MKQISLLAFIFLSLGASAQIENIKVANDSSLIINKLYVGVLNNINSKIKDPSNTSNESSTRIGAQITWESTSWLEFKTFMVSDYGDSKQKVINTFSARIHDHANHLSLEFGKMGTPTTEINPVAPTAAGQFQTWTEAQIPGIAPGIKTIFSFNKTSEICLGLSSREGQIEYGLRFKWKKINLFSSYTEYDEKTSLGFSCKMPQLYSVTVFKNSNAGIKEQIIAHTSTVTILPKPKIDLYIDAGYSFKSDDTPRFELGAIKNFESKIFKGLIALGYCHEIKAVKAYLFIHI